jgi:hypothetical protein
MTRHQVIFRVHAVQRMFERGITEVEVRDAIENGEIIEQQDEARLILGYCEGRPIHVSTIDDAQARATVVITVYEPDPARWDKAFKKRR